MTEEEKIIAAETAAAAAQAQEVADGTSDEAGTDGARQDGSADDKKKSDADYEAELAIERERAEKAAKAAAELAFENRELKRKRQKDAQEGNDDEAEDDEEEKPLTARQLQEALEANNRKILKESLGEMIRAKAQKLAKSDAEAALIVEIHKNRQFPSSLTIDEQLEEAHAIANRKKVHAENAELRRALAARDGASDNAATTHRDAPPQQQPKVSANDAAVLKGAGFEWDGKQGMWKKLLPNKQYLYRDPKTGKTFKR